MNLLKEAKAKLRITWDESNEEIEEMIEDAKSYMEKQTNIEIDYKKEKWAKNLLLQRVRYDYHNALDEFEENFSSEIKKLTLLAAIGKVRAKDAENEEPSQNI